MDSDVTVAECPPAIVSLRAEIIQRAISSDDHFKHQQRGDPDLTAEEKTSIASDLLDNKPSVFLNRFGKYLHEKDLAFFPTGDYTIDFHLTQIRQRLRSNKNKTQVKNRRYEAMKQMTVQGDYFSEDEMKRRDPLLYHQMVGQYLTDDEVQARVDKSDLRFSSILMSHLEITQDNVLYQTQKEVEDEELEMIKEDESEEESELESEEEDGRPKIPDKERARLKGEFLLIMQQSFMTGDDDHFDYSQVDANEEYDCMDIVNQDAEEKYFDGDDDSLCAMDHDCESELTTDKTA